MATQKSDPGADGATSACHTTGVGEPKWELLVDDGLVPMPQQHVLVRLIKSQAGVSMERVLVRDHNSPDDVVLQDDQTVDLASGNVFYTLSPCDVVPRGECRSPAKLALFVNDRAEITIRTSQSGQSLRDLFNLPPNSRLVRDYEGGADREVAVGDTVRFADGPVFFTRAVTSTLQITVNARLFSESDGVQSKMIGKEIAALVYPENPAVTRIWLVSDGNREVGLEETVPIRGCEVFEVVRKNVDGGFEADRVERELDQLRRSGQRVTVVREPQPAVIYHDLRTRPSYPVPATDVLVPIPGTYPGQMLDLAYLPEDSPLIGKVKGQAQDPRITADGKVWRQISYHPHGNGGGPVWNSARHGFHTYLGELLSWLHAAN